MSSPAVRVQALRPLSGRALAGRPCHRSARSVRRDAGGLGAGIASNRPARCVSGGYRYRCRRRPYAAAADAGAEAAATGAAAGADTVDAAAGAAAAAASAAA